MTNGVKGDNVLRVALVSQTLSPSSHIDTDESLDGVVRVSFSKDSPYPSESAKSACRLHFS